MEKSNFSQNLIKEYQKELYDTYGVLVNENEAQLQLLSLTRSMFPIVLTAEKAGSREQGARVGVAALAPARFRLQSQKDDGTKSGIVLPRLRDIKKENYE